MPNIPGTVIAAKITTGDTANTFPIGDQNEMQGGHHSVQTTADRDAIPAERRVEGMTCFVRDTQQTFQLLGGITNDKWTDQATSTAQQLYATTVLAWTGTATADVALRVAADGTNLAYNALQQAWYGTQAAAAIGYPALVTAWAGTAAGTAAIDLANKALVLAQVGTVPPFLDDLQDVDAPAPTASQVLAWDGNKWIATDTPSQVAPGAFTLFLDDTSSGTAPYASLLPSPSGSAEAADVVLVGGTIPLALIDGFLTLNFLNRTVLNGGVWEFNDFASLNPHVTGYVPNVIDTPLQEVVEIYTKSISGVETFLFSGTSSDITAVTPDSQLVTALVSQGTFNVATTDKLLAKYYFLKSSGTMVGATCYHGGTNRDTHFHTPFGVAHNDLIGLQGGQSFEYYHTTADQNAALVGTEGPPSAANKFVTNADSRLATGVAGYYLATSGTAQAQDAHDLAQQAYDLASVNPSQPNVGNWLLSGGNVVWVSGYTFDVPPTVVAFNGTAVSFAGTTVTLQTADPTNDRLDLVVADSSYGTIAVLTGVPTTPPAQPDYDPDTQFQLTFVPVDANTSQPADVDIAWIYLENTEWALTVTHASINVNSTNNPYAGTKDIEGTNCPNGAVVRYQAPFVFELNNYQTLYFYLAPKPGWGTRSLRVQFETSSGLIGKILSVKDTTFGFSTANPAYQLIAIPINMFAVPVGTQILRIRFSVVSSGAALSGFYLDNIGLQLGVTPPVQTIADASTTVKGIVQLEQNGGAVAGRAVTGDDYRLALALTGTNLVAAEAAARTAAVNAEASARSAADTVLQNEINDINADLGITFQGTFALYMANFRNGPPDNKVTVINGVVVGQTPSFYIWEDFENYPSGTLPPLTLGSAWAGAGTIITQPGIGIQAEDQLVYGTGTYLEPFTGTVYQVMSGGTGWASSAILMQAYVGLKGTESFTSYGTGTYPADTGPLIYGIGWAGAGTVIAR